MRAWLTIRPPGMDEASTVTETGVARSLREEFGINVAPERISLEWRSWRWLAHLPDDRVAYIAGTMDSAKRLAKENAVLNLLKDRVSFGIPFVEFSSSSDRLQVRRKIPGIQVGGGPEKVFGNSKLGPRLASDLGRAFAELHQALGPDECEAMGIGQGSTLPLAHDLERRLSNKLPEPDEADALSFVLTRYRTLEIPKKDFVFTHGDPWGGNFAVDPETGALNGLFDFEEMAIDDRNLDLRYLHSFGIDFKDRAIAAYARSASGSPSAERMNLYHLVSAFDALANALHAKDEELIANRRRWVTASINELLDDLT